MAKKAGALFVCQACGARFSKWQGRCTECQEWNSVVEEFVGTSAKTSSATGAGTENKAELLDSIAQRETQRQIRISSGFKEVDRVLGGGFVSGSLLLFGGEPGIGKSTLLLQVLGQLSKRDSKTLYISSEESGPQVASRAKRLEIKNLERLKFLSTTQLEEALFNIEKEVPDLVVVDSVQTIASENIESAPGTVSQVRAVTHALMQVAKNNGPVVLLVGHITKDGAVAGPKLLEHMVDGVFYFELANSGGYRLLRAQKNRFGATSEIAVLEMSSKGLLEVENPSARFLAERATDMPGSVVVAHLEGTRTFLTEFQALTQRCYQGYPRRTVQGVDNNRISVLSAVIEKSLGISFADKDVYCKVASGQRIEEPAADLPMLMALVCAATNKAIAPDTLLVGEVGLGGEVRSVPAVNSRLAEAKSVGLKKVLLPAWNAQEAQDIKGLQVVAVKNVKEAFNALLANAIPKQWPAVADAEFPL